MSNVCHTSDVRLANKLWVSSGGSITPVRRTGELRYLHPNFLRPLTINGRRNDVPGKLMSRINQVARSALNA